MDRRHAKPDALRVYHNTDDWRVRGFVLGLHLAEAGRHRCVESGYFEVDRVREVLPLLETQLAGRRRR